MTSPAYPLNEMQRQDAVNSYQLLDTLAEPSYDGLTTLAASICDMPIALLTILDGERNWFKSKVGIPFEESPRLLSFCGHAILNPNEMMIVPDAREDVRFADNPLVAEMKAAIFYCGVPIIGTNNMPLGTLCVFDDKPRELNKTQMESMKALGFQAEQLLEQRKQYLKATRLNKALKLNNEMLKDFAAIAAHDLKLPIASIITTTDIIKKQYQDSLGTKGLERIELIKRCSLTLNTYITAMLDFYSSGLDARKEFTLFHLHEMFKTVLYTMIPQNTCVFNLPEDKHVINTNEIALMQIFTNLIGNSIKYNDKASCIIDISFTENSSYYYFTIKDNGRGIPEDQIENVFNIFTIVPNKDNIENQGTGIGLATVKRLIEALQGEVSITSEEGESTTVKFSIKKPYRQAVN